MAVDVAVRNDDGQVAVRAGAFTYTHTTPPQPGDPHAYFTYLQSLPGHVRSNGLRSVADVARALKKPSPYVNYVYPVDPYPRRQDGMKMIVPEYDFAQSGARTLLVGIDADDTIIQADDQAGFNKRRGVRIDDEIMIVQSRADDELYPNGAVVLRGQHGTQAVPHDAGAEMWFAQNSLMAQPFHTMDWPRTNGPVMFYWRSWMGREFLWAHTHIDTYKHFNHCNPDENIWGEVRSGFRGQAPLVMAAVDTRSYNNATEVGPNVQLTPAGKVDTPLRPQLSPFTYPPDTWVEYWSLFEPIGDFDCYSLWMATAATGIVQQTDGLQLRLRPHKTTGIRALGIWRWELNTSSNECMPNRGDLVSYGCDWAMVAGVTRATMPALHAAWQPIP